MSRANDEKEVLSLTFTAVQAVTEEGLIAKVYASDPDQADLCGVGGDPIGIFSGLADATKSAKVVVAGAFPVRLGATVADLTPVEANSAYKAVTATGLRPILGTVLNGGAVGELRTCILGRRPRKPITGADVASAGTIVPTAELFTVTGTTSITDMDTTGIETGTVVEITFAASLTFTDGNHLSLAGNFSATAGDKIRLRFDGTNWVELSRSAN